LPTASQSEPDFKNFAHTYYAHYLAAHTPPVLLKNQWLPTASQTELRLLSNTQQVLNILTVLTFISPGGFEVEPSRRQKLDLLFFIFWYVRATQYCTLIEVQNIFVK
jgi:hypothetical protein